MNNNQISWIWWNHFLYLEELLLSSEKHVAFIENNFNTTSITFMHIILAACADIECILKEVLKLDSGNIKTINNKLRESHKDFFDIEIRIPRLNCSKQPWLELKNDGIPSWWDSYNNIKHNKNKELCRDARLTYAIDALAGLLGVNLAYYKMLKGSFSESIKLPSLFDYPGLGAYHIITEDSYNIIVPGFSDFA